VRVSHNLAGINGRQAHSTVQRLLEIDQRNQAERWPQVKPEPKNERITNCQRCGAAIIFLPTAAGKHAPVDAETVPIDAEVFDPKRMMSHFATCPYAEQFRKPKPKQKGK
jgi:hypothetical protein